jgi:hypothetical protein
MSEPENFVSRWWRLKRESGSTSKRKRKTEPRESAAAYNAPVTTAPNEEEAAGAETRAARPVDLTRLPSIDAITAETDIRIFLESGVPAELTRAALRRAWVSDPLIRDFVGVAENQWDFTDPTTLPGFGPLQETGDKLTLVAQTAGTLDKSLDRFSGRLPETHASAEKPRSPGNPRRDEIEDTARETQSASATGAVGSEMSDVAPENGSVEAAVKNNNLSVGSTNPPRRPAHGSALPR